MMNSAMIQDRSRAFQEPDMVDLIKKAFTPALGWPC